MSATFTLNPGALPRISRELLVPLAEGGARIVVDEIKSFMEDAPPRTGHVYLVPGTQTPYVASAPGEPPAVRTGAYRDSWDATPGVDLGDSVFAAAVSGMKDDDGDLLGEKLEFGGGSPPILPRPHVRPALPGAGRKIRSMLRRFEGAV